MQGKPIVHDEEMEFLGEKVKKVTRKEKYMVTDFVQIIDECGVVHNHKPGDRFTVPAEVTETDNIKTIKSIQWSFAQKSVALVFEDGTQIAYSGFRFSAYMHEVEEEKIDENALAMQAQNIKAQRFQDAQEKEAAPTNAPSEKVDSEVSNSSEEPAEGRENADAGDTEQ